MCTRTREPTRAHWHLSSISGRAAHMLAFILVLQPGRIRRLSLFFLFSLFLSASGVGGWRIKHPRRRPAMTVIVLLYFHSTRLKAIRRPQSNCTREQEREKKPTQRQGQRYKSRKRERHGGNQIRFRLLFSGT